MKHLLLNLTGALLLSGMTLSAETLIPPGAKTSWRYWHSAAAPPAAWRDLTFDDAGWPSGPAPLGCDERGLRTWVRIGQGRVTPAARKVTETYLKRHRLEPGQRIPDGYIDGGRGMSLNSEGHAWSSREILLVSRAEDPTLKSALISPRRGEYKARTTTFKDGKLTMEVDRESRGQIIRMFFEGELAGDTLSGSVNARSGENKAIFEFDATKEP